jgi:hypothetical protein
MSSSTNSSNFNTSLSCDQTICSLETTCPTGCLRNRFITPFTRNIVSTNGGCIDEPTQNYTTYQLFCLESKLKPIIMKKYGTDVIVQFESLLTDNKYTLTIALLKDDQIYNISESDHKEIQDSIDDMITNQPLVCLLFWNESPAYLGDVTSLTRIEGSQKHTIWNEGTRISPLWIKNVLPYVITPKEINAFAGPHGLYGTLQPKDNIYQISLTIDSEGNPSGRYPDLYNIISISIIRQLQEMYKLGYIINAESIMDNWDLEPLDDQKIVFRPTWNDERFAPDLVSFLESRIHGESYIRLEVNDNLITRHQISKALNTYDYQINSFYFTGVFLYIEVNNLLDARAVSSIVSKEVIRGTGRVYLIISNNLNNLIAIQKENITFDMIIYKTVGEYILSLLLPLGTAVPETPLFI